jgi:hypothetical protein
MKSKKDIDLEDEYKLTLVYHKVIYCKKREMNEHIEKAKENKLFKYSMPEKLNNLPK